MPSIPGYVYAHKEDQIYVNLFVESETDIQLSSNKVHLSQSSNYPRHGNIVIQVEPQESGKFELLVRIPGWAANKPVPSNLYTYMNSSEEKPEMKINGKPYNYKIDENGYVGLLRQWQKGDKIELDLPMKIHRILAHKNVEADRGKVSLERGPIVYCLEWPDNDGKVLNAILEDDMEISETYQPDKLNGIVSLHMDAKSTRRDADNNIIEEQKKLIAIPYYAWANRGSGEMAVWIPRTAECR